MSFSGHFLCVEGQVGAFLFRIVSSFSLLCTPSSLPSLLPTLSFPAFFRPSLHCQDILRRFTKLLQFSIFIGTEQIWTGKNLFHSLVITVLGHGLVPLRWWSLAVHIQQCEGPSLGLLSFFNFKLFLLMKLFFIFICSCLWVFFTCMLVCAHAWCLWMPELTIGSLELELKTVPSCWIGPGNKTWVLWKSSKYSLTAKSLLPFKAPLCCFRNNVLSLLMLSHCKDWSWYPQWSSNTTYSWRVLFLS